MSDLPEKAAGLLVKAHQHGHVAVLFGVARHLVVGADKDASAGDDRAAISHVARLAFHLTFFSLPVRRYQSTGMFLSVRLTMLRAGLPPKRGEGESVAVCGLAPFWAAAWPTRVSDE